MKYDKESRADLTNLDNFVDAIAKHDWQWDDGDFNYDIWQQSQVKMFSSLADEFPAHRVALDKQLAANAEVKAQIGRELTASLKRFRKNRAARGWMALAKNS